MQCVKFLVGTRRRRFCHPGESRDLYPEWTPALRGCNPIGSPENGGEYLSDYDSYRCYTSTLDNPAAVRPAEWPLSNRCSRCFCCFCRKLSAIGRAFAAEILGFRR